MAGEKSTDIEVQLRVNQICMMMVKGIMRKGDILHNIAIMNSLPEKEKKKKNWIDIEKSERMIDYYIKRAKEQFKSLKKDEIGCIQSTILNQLYDMYKEARRDKKLQTANNIMKNIMYLEGLGRMNLHSDIDVANFDIQLSDEEQEAYKERMKDFYGGEIPFEFEEVDDDSDSDK